MELCWEPDLVVKGRLGPGRRTLNGVYCYGTWHVWLELYSRERGARPIQD